uniref:MD2 domain protein hepatopancreas type n=1 Tax=Hemigrapsus sanguineus TaxID=40176 RepID=A0A482KEV2_HEMSA|nr:MD2 domain protein hepatopancreas type [Hemigrapsus sanguineus]
MWRFELLIPILTSVILGVEVSNTPFRDCGSVNASVEHVHVNPCHTSPCSLYKGNNASIIIEFRVHTPNIMPGNAIVMGVVSGMEIPFPLKEPNICKSIDQGCPLNSTEKIYAFKFETNISEDYPSLNFHVTWKLLNNLNATFLCVQVPLALTQKP